MKADEGQLDQIEGQWDELVRQPSRFAGRRVRVTVLSDARSGALPVSARVQRWLADGDALEIRPLDAAASDAFTAGLVEKFRRQGLVL